MRQSTLNQIAAAISTCCYQLLRAVQNPGMSQHLSGGLRAPEKCALGADAKVTKIALVKPHSYRNISSDFFAVILIKAAAFI